VPLFSFSSAAQAILHDIEREKRFGELLTTASLPLRAAALTPHYAKLNFVRATVREEVWSKLAADAKVIVLVQHRDPDDEAAKKLEAQLHEIHLQGTLKRARELLEAEDEHTWIIEHRSPLEFWSTAAADATKSSKLSIIFPLVKGLLGAPLV
jgi:hypothetical protein